MPYLDMKCGGKRHCDTNNITQSPDRNKEHAQVW